VVSEAAEELGATRSEDVLTGNVDASDVEEMAKFKHPLEYVEGIGPAYAAKLKAIGLVTCLDLLKAGASRKGREEIVAKSGIAGSLILKWVNHVDLYRIKGVGSEYADLLEVAGVDTVVELAQRNPANLFEKMLETNTEKKLVRRTPVQTQVDDWVAQAKTLPRVITY
jgi:predicted flap endonuclease-1-like 5' DNA nuclease